jgi:hypothetical protein
MSKVNQDAKSSRFEDLLRQHRETLGVCQEIIKPLASVLERDGIHEVPLDDSIFTRFESGLVFHASVPLKDGITKNDLGTRTHFVGVLVNTVPLLDAVSRRALEPGSYVVRLRPHLLRGFAFDFIDENHHMVLSTRATSTDPGGFEALPEKPQALKINLGLLNASIGPKSCVDVISGADPLPGPTFPPPGPFCSQEICVSFLKWKWCFVARTDGSTALP